MILKGTLFRGASGDNPPVIFRYPNRHLPFELDWKIWYRDTTGNPCTVVTNLESVKDIDKLVVGYMAEDKDNATEVSLAVNKLGEPTKVNYKIG